MNIMEKQRKKQIGVYMIKNNIKDGIVSLNGLEIDILKKNILRIYPAFKCN